MGNVLSIGKLVALSLEIFLIFLKDRKDPEKAFARVTERLAYEWDNLSDEMHEATHKKDIDTVRNLISDLKRKRVRTNLTKDGDGDNLLG